MDTINTVPMTEASFRLAEPYEGLELAYLDWGDPTSDHVVVCVHGLTRNAHDFDELAKALAGHGARVLAIDVVGRGRSSWLAEPHDYSAENYAAQILSLLAELGVGKVDWIGTSMGGLIGMGIASLEQHPISRLVLNDIGPFVPEAALKQIQSYLGLELRFDSFEELEDHLRFIHAGFGRLTDAQWRHLAKHSARQDADGWHLNYDPGIRVPYAELATGDIAFWELWDKISCPTFVIRGSESPILLRQTAEEMTQRGPKATLATFAGVGHAPALMSRDQIFTIERWLDLGTKHPAAA